MKTGFLIILLLTAVCKLSLGRPRYDENDEYNPDENQVNDQAGKESLPENEGGLVAADGSDKVQTEYRDNYESQYGDHQGDNFEEENGAKRSKLTRKKNQVDEETKEQFADAADEKDPVQAAEEKKFKEDKVTSTDDAEAEKKERLAEKRFNYWGDFYPSSLWEYPYPYYHPLYSCGMTAPCGCGAEEPAAEAKPDEPEDAPAAIPVKTPKKPAPKKPKTKKQLIPCHYYGPPSAGWGGFHPGHTGGGWGAPYWYKRQLIPCHYYGPPSAGWGGFHPGHTGGGWGAPYWYKRQLIPCHYYGPPSAGWGGFHPGHTGGGWGAPYWYKKQLVPSHYYGPPSAGWGGFHPGHTGGGWGAPYWYKSQVSTRPHTTKKKKKNVRKSHKKSSATGSRKFYVVGNDAAGVGHTGCGGWDHGYGKGWGHAWGCPTANGWTTEGEHGSPSIDITAWLGRKGPGAHGWAGHGFVGDPGFGLGNGMGGNIGNGLGGGFGSSVAGGWGHGFGGYASVGSGYGAHGALGGWNAVGNVGELDHAIGAGDFAGFNYGHVGHNTGHHDHGFGHMIGYGIHSHGGESKDILPTKPKKETSADGSP